MQDPRRPRRPSNQERRELIDFLETLLHYDACDYDDIEDMSLSDYLASAYIAVFDHFVSTETGYTGKVIVVVWNFGPECYQAYGWVGGKLSPLAQDARFAV